MGGAADPNEVVGHKTFCENGMYRHEPLTRAEADAAHESWGLSEKRRQGLMPDENTAINLLFDAWLRLKDFGWKEAMYAPRDGTPFLALEAGSTGQHHCHKDDIGCWAHADGDLWPSNPVLFKPIEESKP